MLPREPADPGLRIDVGVAAIMFVLWIALVAIAIFP